MTARVPRAQEALDERASRGGPPSGDLAEAVEVAAERRVVLVTLRGEAVFDPVAGSGLLQFLVVLLAHE